ncbi:hypothetical protein FGRMN_10908 [Fusarium graminum]|nr:hypothetical protein FGRMN_10908 [Fusarium graminum]
MSDTIESKLNAAIDSGKVNGAVVCAVNSKGDFSYSKSFGQRTLLSGEKRSQQLDDLLSLASATKLIASIAAMQCVDDGILTLKGDLSSVVPELAEKKVLLGYHETDDTPLLEPANKPITLEMLLTHSAGTSYHFLEPDIGKWNNKYNSKGDGKTNVKETLVYPLSHQPGESWMYGYGLDWAGRILERVTGNTLEEHMYERILKPLGLKNDAQFQPVTREDLRERFVNLNPDDPDGLGLAVMGGGAEINGRTKGCFGGHGLVMPATSYVKIMQSLLANDGKLLKPETVDDMFQQHLGPEAHRGQELRLAGPLGSFFRVGIPEGIKVGHGLGGVITLEDIDGFYGSNTMSWGGGLTVAWFIDRKNDLCGIAAVCAALPLDGETTMAATNLKDVFRHDIYRKYEEWKDKK